MLSYLIVAVLVIGLPVVFLLSMPLMEQREMRQVAYMTRYDENLDLKEGVDVDEIINNITTDELFLTMDEIFNRCDRETVSEVEDVLLSLKESQLLGSSFFSKKINICCFFTFL